MKYFKEILNIDCKHFNYYKDSYDNLFRIEKEPWSYSIPAEDEDYPDETSPCYYTVEVWDSFNRWTWHVHLEENEIDFYVEEHNLSSVPNEELFIYAL